MPAVADRVHLSVPSGSPLPVPSGPHLARPTALATVATLAIALSTALVACTGGSPAASTPSSPAASAGGSPSPGPISTTQTSWGAILDRAPATFPRYPGADTASGATKQPVTQSLSTDASVDTVGNWYGYSLPPNGYKQVSSSNPAEDGSVTADYDGSSLAAGCRARLTFKPQGSLTFIFVLVSAACPTT